MRAESEQRCKRWAEQRWLLDNTIQAVGPDWDQGRTSRLIRNCGPLIVQDMFRSRSRITKYDDIPAVFGAMAGKWEETGSQAEKQGHPTAASEYYFVAANLYIAAHWAIFEDDNSLKISLNDRKNACMDRVIAYPPHPMERVEVPFEGRSLAAILHLPLKGKAPYPAVLALPGMDSVKEEMPYYGDPLLERGIAVLRIDGPGQGESNLRKIRVTASNYQEAGKSAVSLLSDRSEINKNAIGLFGTSMGSYWGLRVASAEPRLKAAAVSATCLEPGMNSLLNMASPTFKMNYMYMTGYNDEAAFDEFAGKLSLKGLGGKIKCAVAIEAGEYDELSPLQYTVDLFREIKAKTKKLYIFRGDRHSIADPRRNNMASDWLVDRLAGKPAGRGEEEIEYV
ncbi:MAG: alpha/beta hydrolase [Chloroflexi bacterium]|nr:alpha/beta hydrolase [Chloroflexota bacterium]